MYKEINRIQRILMSDDEFDKAQLTLEGRCDKCGLKFADCEYSNNHNEIIRLIDSVAFCRVFRLIEEHRYIT